MYNPKAQKPESVAAPPKSGAGVQGRSFSSAGAGDNIRPLGTNRQPNSIGVSRMERQEDDYDQTFHF